MTRATIINSLFVAIILILPYSDCLAQAKDSKDIVLIQNRLDRIENNLTEIRRDQLNYKVEKDLLKETFSSNYQTINIVLTIVLGLFTVVGFLGIRDIGAIKKEYALELEKMNGLRKDFEIKVSKIGEEQEKVKTDYLEIIKTNEEQSRRIKVLELQEKISSLITAKNYQRALEYAIVGLDLDPHNLILLEQKGLVQGKLNDFEGAIITFTQALKEDPNDKATITNLLEFYLLTKRTQDYDELYSKNRSWIDQSDDSILTMYFNLLKSFQSGLEQDVDKQVREYLQKLPNEQKCYITWSFEEVRRMLQVQPSSKAKTHLTTFINFISGSITNEQALKNIDETPPDSTLPTT